ncbi:COX15/CtaA family protein [Amnibacterium sp. CER49]|uniref:COX15/CtaA family protein n=1 Tax=Amnibacterium sp. CER49 TaxID=3039161 RepID=UPI00244A0FD8|nr:COX15/CtaA family protein [Amnibacterium sp. CER49]MDH2444423.1 COX15/CtaA family protein [Amnibacterium sp. CER49]
MSTVGNRRPRRIRTPFAVLADHVVLGGRALRWGTTAALLVSILLVVTGGVVRVTGSGLGCPTWPVCEAGSLATTPALGIHGVIEFGNRLLTTVLCLAVGWAIVAARLQPVRQRPLTRLAWSQFWLVVGNAVAGGITVWTGLNPYVVALHFLLAFALLTTTTLTWHRARQSDEAATVAGPAGPITWVLTAVAAALVVLGTVVTGAGPHSGDSAAVPRMDVSWTAITAVHGSVAIATIVLALVLLVVLRRAGAGAALARRRVVVLLGVLAAQAAVGIVQAFTGLPAVFVVVHLAGAAFVWVGVLRVLLDVRPDLFGRVRPLAVEATPVREPASAIAGRPQRPTTSRVPSR